jgi:perosamine synthetase
LRMQRTIPPAAAPLAVSDLLRCLAGILLAESYLSKLEKQIRDYFGVRYVCFVSSGKAALYLILQALKSLSARQQVVIPAYTCFSVPSAIVKAGLKVTLCDIEPGTLDFDHDLLKYTITTDTLCVIPNHLFGIPSDMDRIIHLCKDRGVFVVEDAAQAMGGRYKGKLLGTIGDTGFFSLGRGKNITCGSGGIILTNSDQIGQALQIEYARLRDEQPLKALMNLFSALGMRLLLDPLLYWFPAGLPFLKLGETKFYDDFPLNRLGGVRAGLLWSWKERLEQSNSARRRAARGFMERLAPGIRVIQSPLGAKTIYLRLPVMMANKQAKEKLCNISKENGFGISALYPTAIQAIRELTGSLERTDFPAATMVAERLVTLPVHPLVRREDREKICEMVNGLHDGMSQDSRYATSRALGKVST